MGYGLGRKFLRPSAYWKATTRFLNRRILPGFEALLGGGAGALATRPPTFIIGPPRCGSTLAIQVMTEALDVGYVSNSHAIWYGAPAVAERILRWTRRRVPSDFRSDLGRTEGRNSPSECPDWWYRFFPRHPAYVRPGSLDGIAKRGFRYSVTALTSAWSRPLVFKNVYASLRIHPIFESIPESIFIVVRRNEEDVARSLLEARMREFGSTEPWLSVEPPDVDVLRQLPPTAQVRGQVRSIYDLIGADLRRAGVPARQIFEIEYEALCSDPAGCADLFRDALLRCGARVARRRVVWPMLQARGMVA